jgi:DNA-directed RNA polymerase subunit RPC12/RpoP
MKFFNWFHKKDSIINNTHCHSCHKEFSYEPVFYNALGQRVSWNMVECPYCGHAFIIDL